MTPPRLLIEDWLPAAAIGVECIRERSTGQQPPDKRLHVWWARHLPSALRAVVRVPRARSWRPTLSERLHEPARSAS